MYLDQPGSYPAQLAQLWNQRHPGHPLEVLNLGYPGTGSYRLAHIICAALAATRPDIVLLSVGINDIFGTGRFTGTATEPPGERARRGPLPQFAAVEGRDLLRWSDDAEERHRRVRAFKAANTDASGGPASGHETMRYLGQTLVTVTAEEPGQEKGFRYLQHNLGCIHARVRASGATLYLLNYGANSSLYHPANREIGSYARGRADLQFVDIAAGFTEAGAAAEGEALFFEDLHPSAAGYKLMADIIASRLEEALL
jgi:lysophospholipase L1-like esterase